MKRVRVRCGWDWDGIRLTCFRNYYDGPFWELQIGFFWMVWNLGGLPSIFQDKDAR
jgi:hypothetical protein